MTTPAAEKVWRDRTLVALADLPPDAPPAGPSAEAAQFDAPRTEAALIEQVAVRFADRFRPGDREYPLTAGHPRWHDAVRSPRSPRCGRTGSSTAARTAQEQRSPTPAAQRSPARCGPPNGSARPSRSPPRQGSSRCSSPA